MNNVHPLFGGIIAAHMPGYGDLGHSQLARDDAVSERVDSRISELMSPGQMFDPNDAELAIDALCKAPPTVRALLSRALASEDLLEAGRIVSDAAWDYCLAAAERKAEEEECR